MRRSLVVIAVSAAFLLAPQSVLAHSVLLSSQPAPGEQLGTAPGAVVLEFSEPLDGKLSSATVTDPTGQRFSGGVSTSEEMRVLLTSNAPGVYTVWWTSVSATDGHELNGSFQFGVGVTPGGSKAVQVPPVRTRDLFLATGRWVEALSLLVAAGMLVVLFLASREPQLPWVRPRFPVLAVALCAGLLVVWGEAAAASGGPSLQGLVAYLSAGLPGIARMARLVFEGLALVTAARWASRSWLSIWVAGALVALASSGHGASITPAWWGITVDAVHLLAAGVWAGGILALAWQRPPDGWRSPQGRSLLVRFSPVALAAFGVTVAFGLIQATQELGAVKALVGSSYGNVLLVKAALVGAMVPLSLVAWRLRRPQFRIEAPLAAMVVGAAALLATFPIPPGQLVASRVTAGETGLPRTGDLTLGDHAGSILVGLTLEPGTPGENRAVAYLLPLEGDQAASSLTAQLSINGSAPRQLTTCSATCRQTTINIRGGETATVDVGGVQGGTATFSIPALPATDGAALLAKAQQRIHQLHSYQLSETLTTGLTTFRPITGQYTFVAPDRMMSTVNGAPLVWIGTTQYTRRAADQPWQLTPGAPSIKVPTFTWDYFTPFIDPRIVDRTSVDGVPTTVVSFFGGSKETAIWFRLWIDDSGMVRRAQMTATGHFMQDVYSAFDSAPAIVPPSGT
jgi:copper transport protein